MDHIRRLAAIISELKREYDCFPHRCCEEASDMIEELLGLEKTGGLIVKKDDSAINHSWNKDKTHFYDITARQADERLPEIFIVRIGSKEARERYYENVYACW